jgi:hypothetical protein
MPNIQMQKTGAGNPSVSLRSRPAADLEHQPSIANDALQELVHPIAVYCHKQKALVHINQPTESIASPLQ